MNESLGKKALSITAVVFVVFAFGLLSVTLLTAPASAEVSAQDTIVAPAISSSSVGGTCGMNGGACDGSCGGSCGGACGAAKTGTCACGRK